MRKVTFGNGEIYHVYNRGAGKSIIFDDDIDRMRFVTGLMIFNSLTPLPTGKALKEFWRQPLIPADPLVNILAYVLMGNHYHLVLEQLVDNGIAKFMQRLGTGFTKYRNKRKEIKGVIFESTFRAVHIQTEAQYLHISRYIHLNPYDHTDYSWREGKAKSLEMARTIINTYQWSSYQHYLGLKNNPIVHAERILDCFRDTGDYEQFVLSWINRNNEAIIGLMLDENDDRLMMSTLSVDPKRRHLSG